MSSPQDLSARLRRRIESAGPITFAEFMEAALYDPTHGFYQRLVVGEEGAFVTSPHLSPLFGRLVARQVEEFWRFLDRPSPFHLVEVGAGDGTLARQILGALDDEAASAIEYTGVERGLAGRTALIESGFHAVESLEEAPQGVAGCLLANEVLDNVPFHRVRGTEGGVRELFVDVEKDRFVLVEGAPSKALIEKGRLPDVPAGAERVVRPALDRFIDDVANMLSRGYAWIVDYASSDAELGPLSDSVHGYRAHRQVEDVLSDPGTRDVTAGVDFDHVADQARRRGMAVWGPTRQRDALLALGFGELDAEARGAQVAALGERRGMDALRSFSDRNRAAALIASGGLGDFRVIGLGVGVDREPAPASFR
jgi:SAM-dependent MidA family methyltransferase